MSWSKTHTFSLLLAACGPTGGGGTEAGEAGATEGASESAGEVSEATSADEAGEETAGDETAAEETTGDGGMVVPCDDPNPILVDGMPTGFVSCGGGSIDRAEALECGLSAVGTCQGNEDALECTTDADCNEQPGGTCNTGEDPDVGNTWCSCAYQCTTDADCGEGQICRCAGVGAESPRNQCIAADCVDGSDCPSGRCGLSRWEWCNDNWCAWSTNMACRTDQDTCFGGFGCGVDTCAQCGEDPTWSCKDMWACSCPLVGC